jgi:hypothetical protein
MRYFYVLNPIVLMYYFDYNQIVFWIKVNSEFDSIIIWIIVNIIIILPINLFNLLMNFGFIVIILIPIVLPIYLLYEGLKRCDECLSPKPVQTMAINIPEPEIVVQIIPEQ